MCTLFHSKLSQYAHAINLEFITLYRQQTLENKSLLLIISKKINQCLHIDKNKYVCTRILSSVLLMFICDI